MEEKVETVEVANTGQVDTLVEFVAKLDDKSPCKPWLKVEPQSSFLMPGTYFKLFTKRLCIPGVWVCSRVVELCLIKKQWRWPLTQNPQRKLLLC